MKKENLLKTVFLTVLLGLILPLGLEAADATAPSFFNKAAHTTFATQVTELKDWIFTLPAFIVSLISLGVAAWHSLRGGTMGPLLTVFGIIIVIAMIPNILSMIYPQSSKAMVLDNLIQISNQFTGS